MRPQSQLEELLLNSELFREADSHALDAALGAARRLAIPASKVLFRQGDRPERLFIVVEGRLRMAVVSENGAATTLRFMQAGDVLGCAAALKRFSYPATAIATVDSVLLSWTATQFDKLMRDHVQLAINAATLVGARASEMLTRLRALANEPIEQRLARQLLRLQEQAAQNTGTRRERALRISRQELAELADATMFSVSRIVSAWDRAGILSAGRGQVTIADAARLSEIAANGPAASAGE